ncbi:MAG: isoprenylcysteine carboxylmethyltransferase family protein [Nitrolancea sp.]
MKDSHEDTAGIIAPPPLIYGGTLTLGIILHRLIPIHLPPQRSGSLRRVLGMILIAGGLFQALWAAFTMYRSGNNPEPSHPVVSLVEHGPFRFSRNPIYVALTACYLGMSLLLGTLWHLILLPGLLSIMQWGVVRREETYLAQRFGDNYRDYSTRVRRWL